MKPKCRRCKKNTTAKHLATIEELTGKAGVCGPCAHVMDLPRYSDGLAVRLVRKFRLEGMDFDKTLGALRKGMQPPTHARYWAPAGVWHTLDVHEIATRNWRI